MKVPQIVANRDVIRQQTKRKKLKAGITAKFLITGATRVIWDKEDREPEKRGSCAIVLIASPYKDPDDERSVQKQYMLRTNIILPVQNPDFPEHKEPNTSFMCIAWAKVLFPELIPPMPVWNKPKNLWEVKLWSSETNKWEVVETIPTTEAHRQQELQLDVDTKCVELFVEAFLDEAKLKQFKNLYCYATVVEQKGFTNLDHPTLEMPAGRQYGPVEDSEDD